MTAQTGQEIFLVSWFIHNFGFHTEILLSFYFQEVLEWLKTYFSHIVRSKASSFCDHVRLNFLTFAWYGIYLERELSCRLKKVTFFPGFSILDSPCFRKKILLQCLWVPREMNLCFRSKTRLQMFLLVSSSYVGVPQRDSNLASPTKLCKYIVWDEIFVGVYFCGLAIFFVFFRELMIFCD